MSGKLMEIKDYRRQDATNFVLACNKGLKSADVEFVKSKDEDSKNKNAVDYKVILREVRVIASSISSPEFLINKKTHYIYGIFDKTKKIFYYCGA